MKGAKLRLVPLALLGALAVVVLLLAACQAQPAAAPATQSLDILLGEGQTIEEVDGKDQLVGEFHRWEPDVLVVHKGDKVLLNVTNPRKNIHSLAIPAYNVDTGPLDPRGGKKTLEFTADKAGVFQFMCNIPPDEEAGKCDPDHARMVGYLIVLEK